MKESGGTQGYILFSQKGMASARVESTSASTPNTVVVFISLSCQFIARACSSKGRMHGSRHETAKDLALPIKQIPRRC
jgi:hypothetical protein